jgi:hypothetical protein
MRGTALAVLICGGFYGAGFLALTAGLLKRDLIGGWGLILAIGIAVGAAACAVWAIWRDNRASGKRGPYDGVW